MRYKGMGNWKMHEWAEKKIPVKMFCYERPFEFLFSTWLSSSAGFEAVYYILLLDET